ncbi:MAG TPA: nucleoside/nucleotide kinase family protein [Nocardioidaceae bacterium]|nr:nucleoside/nucleotide kinase family protein [Nocardioidaceae bacterium]
MAGFEERFVLGICGPPGAGKSTVAARIARLTSGVVVPMDGFHLSDDELARRGLSSVKGAPSTFDVDAYVGLLRRLRSEKHVLAPAFDRDAEETMPAAIDVLPSHRLVVTEGNYLLLDSPGWSAVRPLLDECWYVDIDDSVRVERLIERHVSHGRSREDATEWVLRSDDANAQLVKATRARADLVVQQ